MVRTQEFISSSFCNRSRRVALAEDLVDGNLHGAPEGTHGAIDRTGADGGLAGMVVAEFALEETAAQGADDVGDDNRLGRARQRVAALFAALGLHETALAEHAQDLGGIGRGDAFGLAHFGNREASALARVADADQAAQAVFFVGAQLHRGSLAMGMRSSMPSISLAASDIRSFDQGGSKVRSILTPVTPGTARMARSTSAGKLPATGQLGAVRVMRMADLPDGGGIIHGDIVDEAELVDVDGHLRIVDRLQGGDDLVFEAHSVDTGSLELVRADFSVCQARVAHLTRAG
jgi:hypothetical protein